MRNKYIVILLVFITTLFPIIGQMNTAFSNTAASTNAAVGISGTVVGADGKPLVSLEVQLLKIENESPVATVKTDKNGSFVFSGLEPGKTYKVKTSYGKDADSALVTTETGSSKPVALKLSKTKGFLTLVANPSKGGFPVWGYVLIGLGAVGAGVGGAPAAGAFDGDGDGGGGPYGGVSPASP